MPTYIGSTLLYTGESRRKEIIMIYYEAICMTGKVRKNNEDNYYINGKYLPMIHGDSPLETGQVCDGPAVFAVFDGMGGEERGEAASYLAAKTLAEATAVDLAELDHNLEESGKTRSIILNDDDLALLMNDRICQYVKEENLRYCGSTLAMISINDNIATCTNVGDTRIYLMRKKKLTQISRDHSIGSAGRKSLTQCLGIPREEFIISPYVKNIPVQEGDVYLLCSDGVTDMLDDTVLEKIMKKKKGLAEMERIILKKGAVDNYTGILIYIR